MEKRKLKKLKINRIKDEFPMIGGQEQMGIKGGQYWAPGYVANEVTVYGSYQNLLPEVTVYGRSFKVVENCSLCQQWEYSATYGGVGSAGARGTAMQSLNSLLCGFGLHNNMMITDTIYGK